jgi:hypothetical protein
VSNPFKNWTQADVEQFNAKHSPTASVDSGPVPGCDDESQLHNQIMLYCERRGWIALHGSMAHKTKRTVGELDFTICADAGRTFFIEIKVKGRKVSIEQAAMIAHLKKLGHLAVVVWSFEEFLSVLTSDRK